MNPLLYHYNWLTQRAVYKLSGIAWLISAVSGMALPGAAASPSARPSLQAGAARPNVIIVMTDDQGYGELSCHGNPILKTPHLDKLSDQSIRLTDFHVTPMCTPTRGQLLTGIDAVRNGAINVSSGRCLLRAELPTMANYFADAGYATGVFGKWHLGNNYPYRPQDRGFEESVWFPSSSIPSVPAYFGNDYFDDIYIKNGKEQQFTGYCTDIFFAESKRFIKDTVLADRPFLLYLATNTPHGPLISKPEDRKAIEKALDKPEFDHLRDQKKKLAQYLGMVRNIDTNMGELVEFLDQEGIAENTILVFLTDNGSTLGPYYYNAGMRGGKTTLWEGGHRVPCFIRWVNGGLTDRDVGGLTQVQDLLPTLIDLCGIPKPTEYPQFDGMNLSPILRGEQTVSDERMLIINFSRMPGSFPCSPSPYSQVEVRADMAGVLWKRWRLLEDRALYNLDADPLQETNVIEEYPEVAEKMRAHLYENWEQVKDTVNEPQRVMVGTKHESPTKLSATEWLDVFLDQQGQVRGGVQKVGFWLLEVAEAGEYEIELRRWPKEADAPISGKLGNGSGRAIPITSASLYFSGHHHLSLDEKRPYRFEGLTKEVKPGDKGVVFTMKLKKGPTALHTWFRGMGADVNLSAYYVYLSRKSGINEAASDPEGRSIHD